MCGMLTNMLYLQPSGEDKNNPTPFMDKFRQKNAHRWVAITKEKLMSMKEANRVELSLVERQRLIKVSEEFMSSEAYTKNKDKYETLMRAKVRSAFFDADTRINFDDFEDEYKSIEL